MRKLAFDPAPIDKALKYYRKVRTHEAMEDLYTLVDPIVIMVLKNICTRFRRENTEDFRDICQVVRLSIYRIMALLEPEERRLVNVVKNGNSLISVVVSATIFDFRDHYRAYKRGYVPRRDTKSLKEFVSTRPRRSKDLPLDNLAIGPLNSVQKRQLNGHGGRDDERWMRLRREEKYLSIEENKDAATLVGQLPQKIVAKALTLNRFNGRSSEILAYCADSIMAGRQPSQTLLVSVWDCSDPKFWPQYTTTLLRLATIDIGAESPRSGFSS